MNGLCGAERQVPVLVLSHGVGTARSELQCNRALGDDAVPMQGPGLLNPPPAEDADGGGGSAFVGTSGRGRFSNFPPFCCELKIVL